MADVYYNPVDNTVLSHPGGSDAAFKLSADQISTMDNGWNTATGKTGGITGLMAANPTTAYSYILPSYTAPQVGSGLTTTADVAASNAAQIASQTAIKADAAGTTNPTNSPYQPSAGSQSISGQNGYNNNTTNPAGAIGALPPNTSLPGGALTDAQGNVVNNQGVADTSLTDKYKSTLANLQATGGTPPTTAGSASAAVTGATPPPSPAPYDPTKADTVLADDKAHQQYLTDYNNYQSSQNQTQTLTQEYSQMVKDAGIPGLNTQLLNMKNIIDGTEQDIRNEVTKAGGFATDSQVLALSNARNKTMIQNYNNLLQTRTDAQNNINTMIGLTQQDRAYALQQLDQKLNFDQQQIQFADKALANAQDSLKTTAQQQGWDTVYRAAVASGDVNAINRINSTMGPGFDLATMASNDKAARDAALWQQEQTQQLAQQKAQNDAANISADNTRANAALQETITHNQAMEAATQDSNARADAQLAETIRHNKADEATASSKVGSSTGGGTSGGNSPITPYLNTSSTGVQYMDASSLQGTAAQKTNLINLANNQGIKVITNKNTAADLINIQDAKSKLQTISGIFQNIAQPSWLERTLGGAGLTQLASLVQSDPRKAAAGALQSVGLDILKAISGVQGFRGNQTAVQQVTEHLPKITDTIDTVNQKISYINALISDRENAALGTTQSSASQVPAGYYQASDGLYYKK